MVGSGWILICEGADAPMIMGTLEPADLYSPLWEVILLNSLFVGVDVSSRTHYAYLMCPDGDKYSSFPLRNTPSDAKLFSISVSILIPWQGAAQVARNRKLPGQNKP